MTSLMNQAGVYKITCKANGKFYIGSAVNFKKRWNLHKVNLRKGNHHSKYMQNCWNKYGQDFIEFEVLLVCKPEQVLMYEQTYLDYYKPAFNTQIVVGSNLGLKFSEETKRKFSEAQRNWRKKYSFNGEELCLSDIAEKTGFDYTLLSARVLGLGKTPEEAIALGDSQIKLYEYNGESKTICAWARDIGVHNARLYWYVKQGLSIAESVKRMGSKEKSLSFSEFCRLNTLSVQTIKNRVNRGMSIYEAMTKEVKPMGARTFNKEAA